MKLHSADNDNDNVKSFKDNDSNGGYSLKQLDESCGGMLSEICDLQDFKVMRHSDRYDNGDNNNIKNDVKSANSHSDYPYSLFLQAAPGTCASIRAPPTNSLSVKYITLIGLGKIYNQCDSDNDDDTKTNVVIPESAFIAIGMTAAKEAKRCKAKSLSILCHTSLSHNSSDDDTISNKSVSNLVKGLIVGSYDDTRFKSKSKDNINASDNDTNEKKNNNDSKSNLKSVIIVKEDAKNDVADLNASIGSGLCFASGIILAKQLGMDCHYCHHHHHHHDHYYYYHYYKYY